MNDKCFEIGTIQAFLDGETAPELSFSLTDHAAKCDRCAALLAEAEEENAQVFAMLDRELNSLVPTQRLWSSITVAIAEEKSHASFLDKARGLIFALFANPSIAVAASVLVVAGLFVTVWNLKTPVPSSTETYVASTSAEKSAPTTENVNTTGSLDPILPSSTGFDQIKATNLPPEKVRSLVSTAKYAPERQAPRAEHAVLRTAVTVEESLPGEQSYIRTIASLKESVDGRKDLIMDPSSRVSFERDLAVVNDSIKKMKDVVRKNPKNQAAKQVLYSSYQNKIDLLNSVVEREELLASLQ